VSCLLVRPVSLTVRSNYSLVSQLVVPAPTLLYETPPMAVVDSDYPLTAVDSTIVISTSRHDQDCSCYIINIYGRPLLSSPEGYPHSDPE
ncbi:MAG: hypothetical protein AAF773_24250, partial [Cyanobacteria bacterium P01_D01_bin.115]